MLERLHIRNYRVFNDLKIDQLSRINLIAGKNNSGKTSLLEAIFLLSGGGNAELALRIMAFRGIDTVSGTPQTVTETSWKPLFSALDMNKTVEIGGAHTSLDQLAMTITIDKPRATSLPLNETVGTHLTELSDTRQLLFSFTSPLTGAVTGRMYVAGQSLKIEPPDAALPFSGMFLSARVGTLKDDARRLGVLRKQKKGHLLLEALQVIEPRLQSIEDNSASGTPIIWGDIGLPELIPLPVMGGGMTQLARLVLSISDTPDGVVLVDEIENGFHHSVLPKVWQAVATAAKQFNTQIFATTHSFECAEAAYKALGADGFLLHRLEASGTENRCVTYELEEIDVALRHNLEIR